MRYAGLWVVAIALCLLCSPVAGAQEQRGSIEGVVKDSSGGVLPGVTVEAKSASGAVLVAVTDERGVFRFPSVAPGAYEVKAELAGFRPNKVAGLSVLLGQIKSLELVLSVGGLAEEVLVTANVPLVDTRQSARAASIRAEQIDLLPKGRDFTTIVTQAAGANQEVKSGGVMIDGATTSENRYIVDGAETGNLVTGASGKILLADFIEEVQVKSSGYAAEYGGATGGVVNVITKSGSNDFRGTGVFYFEDSALQGRPGPVLQLKPTDAMQAEYVTYAKDDYRRMEPGLSLGGPIAKNAAWFFGAFQPTMQRTSRTVTLSADGSTLSGTQEVPSRNLSANATTQFGSRWRSRLAYNNSWSKTDGALPAQAGSDAPGTSFEYGNRYPNWSASAQVDVIARQNLFLGTRAGYYTTDNHSYGVPSVPRYLFVYSNIGMAGVPANLQGASNFASVPNNTGSNKDKQERLSFQADATWYGNFGGQHTVKGGFQIDRLANDVDSGALGNLVQLYWGQSYQGRKGAFGYYRVRSNGDFPKRGFITYGSVSANNYGLFIQDAWALSKRLTLNLGLRTENEKVPPFQSGANVQKDAIRFSFRDKLAPRLGFAADIKGDGKWKAYGSWGVFYDIFKMNLSRGSFGGERWWEYWYTLDTPDWTNLVSAAGCPPACPGTLLRGPYDYRAVSLGSDAIDPNLKPFKSEEASVGLEHQLSSDTAVSVRYVRKWLDRAVDDTGSFDENGEIYVIANPGLGMTKMAYAPLDVALPKARRTYDAVEFTFAKNYSHNWLMRASYLWSRQFGNYSGLDQTDENGRQAPNTGRAYDYPLMSFDGRGNEVEGVLATDRTHQVKVSAAWTLPFGTTVGVNQFVASGIPRTRQIAVLNPSAYPIFYLGRNSDGRMPVYSQTDLQASHEFRLGATRRLQVQVNVLNLLNQLTATNYFATESASGYALSFTEQAFYAHQLDFASLKAAQGIPIDPRFMKANGYQTPIQVRFGVRLMF